MHRLRLERRAFAGLGLSFLWLNVVPATPAAAQAAPTPDQSYYYCTLQMQVHGTTVNYVARVLPNPKPIAKGVAQAEIGRAFVRYLVKKYAPDDPHQFADSPYWGSVCKTSWPYGTASAREPRSRAIAAGAVAVDWEYTPDQDQPWPPAQAAAPLTRPAPATTPHPAATPAPATHPPAAQAHAAAVTTAPLPAPHPAPKPTPPVPKPPKAAFVVCSADSNPHTKYVNPPIDGGSGDTASWQKAYRAYLEPRYNYRGYIRCNRQPTREAAHAFYDQKIEQLRNRPGNGGVAAEIVVTDWK